MKSNPARRPPAEPRVTADASALVLAGLELHQGGRLDEAADLYARALKSDPDNADALNLSGAIAFATGRVEDAIRQIGKAVRLNPTHLDAYLNLAEAQDAAGRRSEAIATCQKALTLAPDFAEGHSRLGWLRANCGEPALALAHARVALALTPDLAEAVCAQAVALKTLRRTADAEAAYRRALDLDPDSIPALAGLAALLGELNYTAEPVSLLRRAVTLRPDDVVLLSALAQCLEFAGDAAAAFEILGRAAKITPGSPEVRFNLGRLTRDNGDFDSAEATFHGILATHPKYAPALHALGRMKRLPDTPDRRKQLSRLMTDTGLSPRHRVEAGFTLGDILDRAQDYDGAFAQYAEANRLHRKTRMEAGERYDRAELRASADLIAARLAREYADETDAWGNPTELPVFVVGMPRSGTTLVEQICASHSQVVGLGESTDALVLARTIADHNGGREKIGDWDAAFARAQADRQAANLTHQAGGALRAVDKTPFNILRLGLISALFPKARVIWCQRDPRDVVVSNHTMFFGAGNLFSTDQSDCAYAARLTNEIGGIWRDQGKLPVLEVVYEDLVADLDTHVRRIIDFLGLDWEPACLDFHRTDRHVDTPSAWQVRQPIYSSSVGRWRRFERHLGPMLDTLASDD